jgi:hypothetical protein
MDPIKNLYAYLKGTGKLGEIDEKSFRDNVSTEDGLRKLHGFMLENKLTADPEDVFVRGHLTTVEKKNPSVQESGTGSVETAGSGLGTRTFAGQEVPAPVAVGREKQFIEEGVAPVATTNIAGLPGTPSTPSAGVKSNPTLSEFGIKGADQAIEEVRQARNARRQVSPYPGVRVEESSPVVEKMKAEERARPLSEKSVLEQGSAMIGAVGKEAVANALEAPEYIRDVYYALMTDVAMMKEDRRLKRGEITQAQHDEKKETIRRNVERGLDWTPGPAMLKAAEYISDEFGGLDKWADRQRANTKVVRAKLENADETFTSLVSQGRISEGFRKASIEAIGSMPYMMMAMVPGVGTTAVGLSAGKGKYEQLVEEGYDIGAKEALNSVLTGAFEGITEAVSGKIGKEALKMATRYGRDFAVKGVKAAIVNTLGRIAGNTLEEAGSEALAQLAENIVDKATIDKGRNIFEGVLDAAVIGGIAGGGVTSTGAAIGAAPVVGRAAADQMMAGTTPTQEDYQARADIMREEAGRITQGRNAQADAIQEQQEVAQPTGRQYSDEAKMIATQIPVSETDDAEGVKVAYDAHLDKVEAQFGQESPEYRQAVTRGEEVVAFLTEEKAAANDIRESVMRVEYLDEVLADQGITPETRARLEQERRDAETDLIGRMQAKDKGDFGLTDGRTVQNVQAMDMGELNNDPVLSSAYRVADALKGLGVPVLVVDESSRPKLEQTLGKEGADNVLGSRAVYASGGKGKSKIIMLNRGAATSDSALHEGFHVIIEHAATQRPEEVDALVQKIKPHVNQRTPVKLKDGRTITVGEYLDLFVAQYKDRQDVQSEEYLAELGAVVSQGLAEVKDKTALGRIEKAINDFIAAIIGENKLVIRLTTSGDAVALFNTMQKGLQYGDRQAVQQAMQMFGRAAEGRRGVFASTEANVGAVEKEGIDAAKEDKLKVYKQIVGERADLRADILENLEFAKKLAEKSGDEYEKSRRAIWNQTGWEKGVDGKWRYEVPYQDLISKESLPRIARGLDRGNSIGLRAALGTDSEIVRLYNDELIVRSENVIEDRFRVTFQEEDDSSWRGAFRKPPSRTGFGTININPDVYGYAMSMAKNYYLVHKDEAWDKLMSDEKLAKSIDDLNSTFTHEVQHAIQYIEGFESGANSNYYQSILERVGRLESRYLRAFFDAIKYEKELMAAEDKLNQDPDLANKKITIMQYRIFSETFVPITVEYSYIPDMLASFRKRWEDSGMADDYYRKGREEQAKLDGEKSKLTGPLKGILDSFAAYRATAGEVESRAAQQRRKLTDVERKVMPISEFYDIATESIIFLSEVQSAVNQQPEIRQQKLSVEDFEWLGPEGQENFRKWVGDAPIVDGEDVLEIQTGQPVVIQAFHGTTNSFYSFDKANEKGEIGGQFGKVNYFTSDQYDAQANYTTGGPDLEYKIRRDADDLSQSFDMDGLSPEEVIDMFNLTDAQLETFDRNDLESLALAISYNRHNGGEDKVLDLFVKLNNPVRIADDQYIDMMPDVSAYMEDAAQEMADENDITPEEALEDYEFDVRQRALDLSGEELTVVQALQDAIDEWAPRETTTADQILEDRIYEDSISTAALEAAIRRDLPYAEDEEGRLVSSQIVAQTFRNLGHDGIIINASVRFPSMDMQDMTAHIHVFDEFANQIKLADGSNMTFGEGVDIRQQKKIDTTEKLRSEPPVFDLSDFTAKSNKRAETYHQESKQRYEAMFDKHPSSVQTDDLSSLERVGKTFVAFEKGGSVGNVAKVEAALSDNARPLYEMVSRITERISTVKDGKVSREDVMRGALVASLDKDAVPVYDVLGVVGAIDDVFVSTVDGQQMVRVEDAVSLLANTPGGLDSAEAKQLLSLYDNAAENRVEKINSTLDAYAESTQGYNVSKISPKIDTKGRSIPAAVVGLGRVAKDSLLHKVATGYTPKPGVDYKVTPMSSRASIIAQATGQKTPVVESIFNAIWNEIPAQSRDDAFFELAQNEFGFELQAMAIKDGDSGIDIRQQKASPALRAYPEYKAARKYVNDNYDRIPDLEIVRNTARNFGMFESDAKELFEVVSGRGYRAPGSPMAGAVEEANRFWRRMGKLLGDSQVKNKRDFAYSFDFRFGNFLAPLRKFQRDIEKQIGVLLPGTLNAYDAMQLYSSASIYELQAHTLWFWGDNGSKSSKDKSFVGRVTKQLGGVNKFNEFLLALHLPERLLRKLDLLEKYQKDIFSDIERLMASAQQGISSLQTTGIGTAQFWQVANQQASVDPNLARLIAKFNDLQQRIAEMNDAYIKALDRQAEFLSRISGQSFPVIQPGQPLPTNPELNKYMQFYEEFRDKMLTPYLDALMAAGRIDQKRYDHLVKGTSDESTIQWKYYVPMMYSEDAVNHELGITNGERIVNLNGIEGLSKPYDQKTRHKLLNMQAEDVVRPLELAFARLASATRQKHRQDALRRFAELARQHGATDRIRVFSARNVPKMDKYGNIVGAQSLLPKEILENSVPFYEGGKVKYIYFSNPGDQMLAMLRSPDVEGEMSTFMKWYSAILGVMRIGITSLSPTFILNNFLRDIQESSINIRVENDLLQINNTKLKKAWRKRWREAAAQQITPFIASKRVHSDMDRYYAEYLQIGASMGWNFDSSGIFTDIAGKVNERIRDAERVAASGLPRDLATSKNAMIEMMMGLSARFENVSRLAAYASMRDLGVDPIRAAAIAKNITLNFEKKGQFFRGSAGRFISGLYLFLNAGLQSGRKLVKQLSNPAGRRMLALYGMGSTAFRVMLHALYATGDDDEEPKEKGEITMQHGLDRYMNSAFMRQFYLAIPNPFDVDDPVLIPRPYGALRVVGLVADGVVDASLGKRSLLSVTSDVKSAFFTSLDPIGFVSGEITNAVPTLMRPFAEVIVNRDWMGRQILFSREDTRMYAQANKRTLQFYKDLTPSLYAATGLSISPTHMEHIIESYTRTLYPLKFAYGWGKSWDDFNKSADKDKEDKTFTEWMWDQGRINLIAYKPNLSQNERQDMYNFMSMTDVGAKAPLVPPTWTDQEIEYLTRAAKVIRREKLLREQDINSQMVNVALEMQRSGQLDRKASDGKTYRQKIMAIVSSGGRDGFRKKLREAEKGD